MKQSEGIAKLAAALVKAQAELQPVAKESENPHFRSKFASLDAIIEAVRPVLARHGLAVVQGATLPESDEHAKLTGLTVETMLVHESGEWITGAIPMPLAKADPQGAGSAMTYGRRYGLSALLCIATEDDDDANAASRPKAAKRESSGGRTAGVSQGTASTDNNNGLPRQSAPANSLPLDQTKQLPFGGNKGTPLDKLSVNELKRAVEWAKANKPEKYGPFIEAAELLIDEKSAAGVA